MWWPMTMHALGPGGTGPGLEGGVPPGGRAAAAPQRPEDGPGRRLGAVRGDGESHDNELNGTELNGTE